MEGSGFSPFTNNTLSDIHKQSEDTLLNSLLHFDQSFQIVQKPYTDGIPPITGERISLLLGSNAELCNSMHVLQRNLIALHMLGFKDPFDRIRLPIKNFFSILRHCANEEDWESIKNLEDEYEEVAETISDFREQKVNPAVYCLNVGRSFERIDSFFKKVRGDVRHRETDIMSGHAKPIVYPADVHIVKREPTYKQSTFDFSDSAKLDGIDSKIDAANSKLEAANSKIEAVHSKLSDVDSKVNALSKGKARRTNREFSEQALKFCATIWLGSKSAFGSVRGTNGRPPSKLDVYTYHSHDLNTRHHVMSVDDFRHAIDDARKRFPELFPKSKTSEKPVSRAARK